jgi:hypothetical protein
MTWANSQLMRPELLLAAISWLGGKFASVYGKWGIKWFSYSQLWIKRHCDFGRRTLRRKRGAPAEQLWML